MDTLVTAMSNVDTGQQIVRPALEEIDRALEDMNCRELSGFGLVIEGHGRMTVGYGGEEDTYYIVAELDGQLFALDNGGLETGKLRTFVFGGLGTDVPERELVSLDDATEVVHSFAIKGILDPTKSWHML